MTYQEKIVKFMEFKQELISQADIELNNFYFNNLIKSDILSWPNDISRKVWDEMNLSIYEHYSNNLSAKTCPYCKYTNHSCKNCFYGKIMGICNRIGNNTYEIVLDSINSEEIFTNNVYKDIINKIKIMEKKKR